MGIFKNLTAGLIGSIALNVLHETLRKTYAKAPQVNRLGAEAINKTLDTFGSKISDKEDLYVTTLVADIVSNTFYYSLIGGERKYVWPKAVLLGLSAGIGALNLPEPMGLDPKPVTRTNQTKVLTVTYYLFGALITAMVLSKNPKR